MDAQPKNPEGLQSIGFPNGRQAQLLGVDEREDPASVLARLGIQPPRAVIVISGGAGKMAEKQLHRLAPFFSLGIARAAGISKATVIDGGTQAGVMKLMGMGVADEQYGIELIGVVPSGKVSYPGSPAVGDGTDRAELDPNHSHFVLVSADQWGKETPMMYSLADALQQGALGKAGTDGKEKRLPVVTVLVGGSLGGVALREAQATVRKGWPLVVMEGSGELADEIALRYRDLRLPNKLGSRVSRLWLSVRRRFSSQLQDADAVVSEIVEEGQIIIVPKKSKPSDLEKLLVNQLKEKPEDSILLRAWKRFALYDQNAARHQKTYRVLKSWPLILGVLATTLVLLNEFLTNPPVADLPFREPVLRPGDFGYELLHVLIILTPIVTALFLAADRLFKSGNKWILLRYYAEEIKKDIYSYRVLSSLESRPDTDLPDEVAEMSDRLTKTSQRLMRTEVNESALEPYIGPIPPKMYGSAAQDDGVSPLDPESYVSIRINDQYNFYALRANKLEKQLQPRQWLILIFGAIGSLLAALGGAFQFWVPLSVAFVSAITAYVEYQQMEQTIIKYNQAMTRLANLMDWWVALKPAEKLDPRNVLRLVEEGEGIMESEHLGWVQQMQNTQTEPGKQSSAEEPRPAEEPVGASPERPSKTDGKGEEQPAEQPVAAVPEGDS